MKEVRMNWTQSQQAFDKSFKKIDKLVKKYVKNPNHKDAQTWKQQILFSGLYDEQDLEYLLKG